VSTFITDGKEHSTEIWTELGLSGSAKAWCDKAVLVIEYTYTYQSLQMAPYHRLERWTLSSDGTRLTLKIDESNWARVYDKQ
jgi:hypothetical protein